MLQPRWQILRLVEGLDHDLDLLWTYMIMDIHDAAGQRERAAPDMTGTAAHGLSPALAGQFTKRTRLLSFSNHALGVGGLGGE